MATATAPRNDVYISLLAGRAITSLVDLASNPSVWSKRVEVGLRDGIRYCQAVRVRGRSLRDSPSEAWSPLRRSLQGPEADSPSGDECEESSKVERFLAELLLSQRTPAIPELVEAIEFLRKTATER
jgi:hypothetical protein